MHKKYQRNLNLNKISLTFVICYILYLYLNYTYRSITTMFYFVNNWNNNYLIILLFFVFIGNNNKKNLFQYNTAIIK
jgi:hypothetical protein